MRREFQNKKVLVCGKEVFIGVWMPIRRVGMLQP